MGDGLPDVFRNLLHFGHQRRRLALHPFHQRVIHHFQRRAVLTEPIMQVLTDSTLLAFCHVKYLVLQSRTLRFRAVMSVRIATN